MGDKWPTTETGPVSLGGGFDDMVQRRIQVEPVSLPLQRSECVERGIDRRCRASHHDNLRELHGKTDCIGSSRDLTRTMAPNEGLGDELDLVAARTRTLWAGYA